LQTGDVLVLPNGDYVFVEDTYTEELDLPVTIYNFEVEDFHTYFVGESHVLVHNNSCANGLPDATPSSRRFDGDQQAVLDLAKENKNGVSLEDAETLVGWADEYGISTHGPMIHPERSGFWSYTLHIKIKNYHIPIVELS